VLDSPRKVSRRGGLSPGKLDCRKICSSPILDRRQCVVLFVISSFSSPSHEGQVFIVQKDFDLNTADSAIAFLREMYSLVEMLEELAGNLDRGKSQVAGSCLTHLENPNGDLCHRFAFLECIEGARTRSNVFEC